MGKIKSIIIVAVIILLLLAMNIILIKVCVEQGNETKRLSSNIDALRKEMVAGLSKDGKETATIQQQTLTKMELKEIIHDELKTLNIKERDVKQAVITSSVSVVDVPIDTAITKDTATGEKEYQYHDEWCDLRVDADSAHISVKDSLLVLNHAKTRKFLWWKWKKYSGKTTIKNYSPYSHITGITSMDVEQ